MVAQFITLFAGLVIIVENYIHQTLIAAGEADTTAEKISILTYLVYLSNGAVVAWPALDGFMQASPSETLAQLKDMCASFVRSGTTSKSADPPILSLADQEEELGIGPCLDHKTLLGCPDTEQQTPCQNESNQNLVYSSQQAQGHIFEHAGGVRIQAQPESGCLSNTTT
jgi:hypothetical protein